MVLRASISRDDDGNEITNIDFDSPDDFAPYAMSVGEDIDLTPLIQALADSAEGDDPTGLLMQFLSQS